MTVDSEFKIGKWFSGHIFPAWINAPSTLQSAHNFHGKNVVACHLEEGGFSVVYSKNGKPICAQLPENTPLEEGWNDSNEIGRVVENHISRECKNGNFTTNICNKGYIRCDEQNCFDFEKPEEL